MAWAPDYATAAELREYATRSGVTVDDAQISLAVTAASRAVDRHCGRQFGRVDEAELRSYDPWWHSARGVWVVDIDDLMDADGLIVEVGGQQVTDFVLLPRNAPQRGRPWTRLQINRTSSVQPACGALVDATAVWGWSDVPAEVKQATLLQGNRFMARRDSPFGIAGSPELGNELRLLARLDPDVAVSVAHLVRWRVR